MCIFFGLIFCIQGNKWCSNNYNEINNHKAASFVRVRMFTNRFPLNLNTVNVKNMF